MRNRALSIATGVGAAVIAALLLAAYPESASGATGPSAGSLQIIRNGQPAGFCPLRHTDVKIGVSGFVARTVVTQDFENDSAQKIEAVYTFPLPENAAVDDMTIEVGGRTIRGVIKRSEEAAAIYQKALTEGRTAALLDQERPNIFTQSVGNIPPGEKVRVTIQYVTRLKYEDGNYELFFPMVVGERYTPADADKLTPTGAPIPTALRKQPTVPAGTRPGHDISIAVALDAAVPLDRITSPTHEIHVERTETTSAVVMLRDQADIPNRDFILRYDVAGNSIVEGLLTHAQGGKGYFTLIVQPPERFAEWDVTPKELIFVLDSSGSMSGFPIEKSKKFMEYALDGLYAGDTFNVIKFSGETAVLFEQPVYASADKVAEAREFVAEEWGGGGTEMMKAIRAALAPSGMPGVLRIVVFLTDGYVGNDMEITAEVQKYPEARVFAFGIGSSVNRFLLDKMAEAGRGEVEYVSHDNQDAEAEAAARRLYDRIRAPLLTDISLDFGSLPVNEMLPRHIPDLFSEKPVVVTGRYSAPGSGIVRLTARRAGQPYSRDIPVTLPGNAKTHAALPGIWARQRIDALMSQDWAGAQQGTMRKGLREEVTRLGLEYRLMTQFTSFVAVEERVTTVGGRPKRVQVPVATPAGVQGNDSDLGPRLVVSPTVVVSPSVAGAPVNQRTTVTARMSSAPHPPAPPPPPAAGGGGGGGGVVGALAAPHAIASGSGGGIGGGHGPGVRPGTGGGIGGGVFRVGGGVSAPLATYHPAPEYSEEARKANVRGVVVLSGVVNVDGALQEPTVVRSLGMGLDERALAAVRKWKFQPAFKEGKAVPVRINIEIPFGVESSGMLKSADGREQPLKPVKLVRVMAAKLHERLLKAFDCWHGLNDKSQFKQVCGLPERLYVQMVLSESTDAMWQSLQTVGFDPEGPTNNRHAVRGTVPVEHLEALAEMKGVRFVAPARP